MKSLQIAVLSCVLAATAQPLAAQQARLTLEQALERFAASNLELRLARARAAEAAGLATQTEAFPNPSVSATHEPLARGGATHSESYLNLSQRLELPGKRGARAEAGDRMRTAALSRLRADSVRLAFEVKRAYVLAALGSDRVAVTERVAAVFRQADAAAAARYRQGDVSRYEVGRISVERARYENLTADAALEAAAAGRALAQLVAPTEELIGLTVDPLPGDVPPALPEEILAAGAASLRAELAAARADAEAAAAQARLARAERLPDLTATGGFKRQSDGLQGAFLGVSVPLPLFDRNAGAIAAAEARARAADDRVALTGRQVEDDLRGALEAYASLRGRATRATERPVAEATNLLDMARIAYDAGEMELVQLLDAAESLHQARTAEARLRADLWIAYYDLERAMGGFDAGSSSGAGDGR